MSNGSGLRWHERRWPKTGAGILLIGVVLQGIAWYLFGDDRTSLIMSVLYFWPAVLFLLMLWWCFLSGFRGRTRLAGVAVVAVVALGFWSMLRIEDYRGDMIPQFSFRWNPTKEEVAREYWESQAASNAEDSTARRSNSVGMAEGEASRVRAGGNWPGFRGPNRDGVVQGIRLLVSDWSSKPARLLWKHPVGLGWSSFAVVDGLAFTQEQRLDEEVVACYDVETGSQVWVHADAARFESVPGGDGPRGTPTIDESRLYSLGATGILNCLNLQTGERIWSRNVLDDAGAENISWGMAGSPLVYDEVVVVNPGGDHGNSVVAYNRNTGEQVWSAGNGPAGYSAPRLEMVGGTRQVLVFGGAEIAAYDADAGSQLWSYPWVNQPKVNATQPVVIDDESVFIGSGYGLGAARLRVTKQNGTWHVDGPVWINTKFRLKFNDAVRKDDFVYGLDEGILTCVDLKTGKRMWKRGRYGYGQMLLVDDLLLILTESGEVVLVEANPGGGAEVLRFQAIEGKTWNHPAMFRNRLLVRNAGQAACYELPVEMAGSFGIQ